MTISVCSSLRARLEHLGLGRLQQQQGILLVAGSGELRGIFVLAPARKGVLAVKVAIVRGFLERVRFLLLPAVRLLVLGIQTKRRC